MLYWLSNNKTKTKNCRECQSHAKCWERIRSLSTYTKNLFSIKQLILSYLSSLLKQHLNENKNEHKILEIQYNSITMLTPSLFSPPIKTMYKMIISSWQYCKKHVWRNEKNVTWSSLQGLWWKKTVEFNKGKELFYNESPEKLTEQRKKRRKEL